MTAFYVREFNRRTKCRNCEEARTIVGKRVFSLCEQHLNTAAEHFRCWYNQRKLIGKCHACNRNAIKGTGRCSVHAQINRERCARWMVHNRFAHYDRQAIKKEGWLSKGLCICRNHNPLDGVHRRCDQCRLRNRKAT